MKKTLILCALSCLMLASCQKEDEVIETNGYSSVDKLDATYTVKYDDWGRFMIAFNVDYIGENGKVKLYYYDSEDESFLEQINDFNSFDNPYELISNGEVIEFDSYYDTFLARNFELGQKYYYIPYWSSADENAQQFHAWGELKTLDMTMTQEQFEQSVSIVSDAVHAVEVNASSKEMKVVFTAELDGHVYGDANLHIGEFITEGDITPAQITIKVSENQAMNEDDCIHWGIESWYFNRMSENPDPVELTSYEIDYYETDKTYYYQVCVKLNDEYVIESDVKSFSVDSSICWGSGTTVDPYSVGLARLRVDYSQGTWVSGYIVGCVNGDDASKNAEFGSISADATNVLIADKKDVTSIDECLLVYLSEGELRNQIHSADSKEYIGEIMKVYGKVSTYLNMPGIKEPEYYEVENSVNYLFEDFGDTELYYLPGGWRRQVMGDSDFGSYSVRLDNFDEKCLSIGDVYSPTTEVDCIVISPALNVAESKNGKVSFKTKKFGFNTFGSLYVYVLDKPNFYSSSIREELEPKMPTVMSQMYVISDWAESGELDLKAFGKDIVYIGFRYKAPKGHGEDYTTWYIDDFKFE